MINPDASEYVSHCKVRTELRRILREAKILAIELIDGWYFIRCDQSKSGYSDKVRLELRYDFKVKAADLETIFKSATTHTYSIAGFQSPIKYRDITTHCTVVEVGWKPEASETVEKSWVLRRRQSNSTWRDAPLQVINEQWVRAAMPTSQPRR